jgi:hypothetical protein
MAVGVVGEVGQVVMLPINVAEDHRGEYVIAGK